VGKWLLLFGAICLLVAGTMTIYFAERISIEPNIIAANYKTFYLSEKGRLYAWGDNSCGELGDGTTGERYRPVQVLNRVVQISAGYNHTVAIRNDNTLWGWGQTSMGQLGDVGDTLQLKPLKLEDSVISTSAGASYTMIIDTDWQLRLTGDNEVGQLGIGSTKSIYKFQKIMGNVRKAFGGPA